ncbi:LON peptidase substrate-binding domain-containing protein [Consotaella salsifontis]|uniref:Lon N-terminal domain-containing protein n=1 Tax=Consotaella salsifontis TaxID=1365950 RepID=A0A1T4SDA9_9HYPH|nr:LON peptidase substrate-binding domain-containing protein [Consotaella salsifontis]SKA25831.1 hypothetical protein SAMN05428963_11016 [Consotaella salsifontis]
MVQAGNATYRIEADLPDEIPVFPLSGVLLLPGGQLPLNIFEPRYLKMIDDAMAGDRLIGMIQPRLDGSLKPTGEPELAPIGCLGRIISLSETGDGRYIVNLAGVARFRVNEELKTGKPYRRCRIANFLTDLEAGRGEEDIDREGLLSVFRRYLDVNGLEADWDSVAKASNETLVNAFCIMSPYGAAEKQALIEAADLKTRAETLIAITEIALAREGDDDGETHTIQ